MILVAGHLVPATPPEFLWIPEVPVQVYDPWTSLWLDLDTVNYMGGMYILNFKSVSPPLELLDIAILNARVKNADDKSSS